MTISPWTHLKNLSIKSTAWRKFSFLSQKKLMVEIFSGSHKTLKVANNLLFRCCWSFFCSSEELTQTNVQVQFRVIPFFKFHHLKGFYSANCPGVTQELALRGYWKYIFVCFGFLGRRRNLGIPSNVFVKSRALSDHPKPVKCPQLNMVLETCYPPGFEYIYCINN